MSIEARGLSYRYPGGRPVFTDTSLVVAEGELAALVGPSGSGKTTLLSVLAALVASQEGELTVAGARLDRLDDASRARFRRKNVGFVFQGYHLIGALDALANVVEPLVMRGVPRAEARTIAERTLDALGLAELAPRLPRELSGGEKQRVAIARAIAGKPKIVFADEPTAALDLATARSVVALLRAYAHEGGTVLLVTHDTRLSSAFDRTYAMDDGHVTATN